MKVDYLINSFARASASNLGLFVADLAFLIASDCPFLLGVLLDGVPLMLLSLQFDGVFGVFGVLGVSLPLLVDRLLFNFFTVLFSSNLGRSPVKMSEYLTASMFNLLHASGYIQMYKISIK